MGSGGVFGFLCLTEIVGRLGRVDPDVLPYVSTVLAAAAGLVMDGEFLHHVLSTLTACAAGLLIAAAVAVPAGLLLGTLPMVERSVRPLVEFLRPIPSVSLIPLAMFTFPDSGDAKISLIVYTCAWPMLINTMYGLADVDPLSKQTLRSFGFGPLAVVLWVSLPSAAPFIWTGIRIATGVTLIVAVSVEIIVGGGGGIGVYLVEVGSANRLDHVLAATVWAGLFGLAANLLFAAWERRLFRWRQAGIEEAR